MAKKKSKTAVTITDTVKVAIRDCGISRYELAKRSGVTEAALCRFMGGVTGMQLSTLERLAPFIGAKIIIEQPEQ